jgi:transposase-like protein
MLRLYQRFQQSNLTRAAFCREEGITAAQFTYWCSRFEHESIATEVSQAPITLAQVSTPIQAVQEPVVRKTLAEKPEVEPTPATSPGFTRLHLPESSAFSTTTPVIPTRPLIVLALAWKGRIEFYTLIEASFLKTLLG